MHLAKIKLAGFKSFVDPTTFLTDSRLVGIVGPNGCGKSNVIDAVRWVIGESSARHLRAESMADVIFNGSSARKPVGQALVELVFDNSDGGLSGQYAQYNEVSVKRAVARDGQSSYFLNGTRCRRRDITDLFLGTGLGPHSYAIIEQGMISRLIEARAEDLRMFLEEAAGISRYKERRRETELRLRNTQDNLSRLNDLRGELGNQIEHLREQAETAKKYQKLKEQERLLKAQSQAVRWRGLDAQVQAYSHDIEIQSVAAESRMAEVRAKEAALERLRVRHAEANETFSEVQARFYGLSTEIARQEQALQSAKERRQHLGKDMDRVEQALSEAKAHSESDAARCAALEQELAASEEVLQGAQQAEQETAAALAQAEEEMNGWQARWEELAQQSAGPTQTAQVERTRLQQLESQGLQLQQRLSKLSDEERALDPCETEQALEELALTCEQCEEDVERGEAELAESLQRITEQRNRNRAVSRGLDDARGRLSRLHGRLESLQALQRAALGRSQQGLSQWLDAHGLRDAATIAQSLTVEPGWERAVECVLGHHLQALCVQGLEGLQAQVEEFGQGILGLFDITCTPPAASFDSTAQPLRDKVRAPWPLDSLMAGVYAVRDLTQAMALHPSLAAHESAITIDGIWLGHNWLRAIREADEVSGVLTREREIRETLAEEQDLHAQLDSLERELETGRTALHELEAGRERLNSSVNALRAKLAELKARRSAEQVRLEHMRARAAQVLAERRETERHLAETGAQLAQTRSRLTEALTTMESLAERRDALQVQRGDYQAALQKARERARAGRDAMHQTAMRAQGLRSTLESTRQAAARLEEQVRRQLEQREELSRAIVDSEAPTAELRAALERHLAERGEVEAGLGRARAELEAIQHELAETERLRHHAEHEAQGLRERIEQARLQWQEHKVRAQTLEEELAQSGLQLAELLRELPADVGPEEWQDRQERLAARIQRLGPVNLAAIDELEQQSQRKQHLDAQFDDLQEAVHTLEGAIRTIDRETRNRFQEIFEQVNQGLQRLFPRLFGGGTAFLELAGEELLDAGVAIMARPPGKRISSIHLLSGGEKALTAVALVFAIFELNPAPFCLLDEVDAPLDEANVGRFCDLVKEMASRVQFIFITHNKVTMELAQQLTGVTMQEAGVSRLVAVDVEEAVAMAAI